MRWCLACRRLSPRNSAYCGGCGKSFSGSRCPSGHLTPGLAPVRYCPVCRSTDIVPATPSLGFGWLAKGAAWLLALLLIRLCLANLGLLAGWAWSALGWLVGNPISQRLGGIVSLVIALRVLIWCIGLFDPELAGRADPFPRLGPALGKASVKTLALIGKTLARAVEGVPPAKPEKRKDHSAGGR